MSESLVLIEPPAVEPVLLGEFRAFLEIPPGDASNEVKLTGFLAAAREDCEKWTRTKLITQTWLMRSDGLPSVSVRYDRNGYAQIRLSHPPFQSIVSFHYVDTAGQVQQLMRDISYGNDPTLPIYSYQLQPGGGMVPARLMANWARPWPPERLVPANTMIQFRCGYGGPLTVSMAAGSAVLAVAGGFTFNPDDAPNLTGDKGTAIRIPGAGAAGADLVTNVAAVDSNGVATLAASAVAAVANVPAWMGRPVPESLRLSILFHAQFFYEQGAVVDQAIPRVVESLRKHYRNLVS